MTYSVAVSGASGYAGGEILRILAAHPDVEIRTVTAHSNAGQPLIQHQPHLRSLAHLTLQDTTPEVLAGHDIVFLALPHGQSGQYTDALPGHAARDRRGCRPPARIDRRLGPLLRRRLPRSVDLRRPRASGRRREAARAARRGDPDRRPRLQRLDRQPEPRARRRGRRHRSVRHRHGARGRPVRCGQEPASRTCSRARSSAPRTRMPSAARTGTSPRSGRRSPRRAGRSRHPTRRRRHPHLVHARPRADGARHPRDLDRADRARARRMPTSAVRGRPLTATRPSCSCCRPVSSRARPTCWAPTPRCSGSRSIVPRTASSSSPRSTTSSKARRAPPSSP